jgi:hypothetical protein
VYTCLHERHAEEAKNGIVIDLIVKERHRNRYTVSDYNIKIDYNIMFFIIGMFG